ncbi:MAG: hypothetical protein IKH63_01950 [Prevotella sp.]|nr:hypothetical protein [Prevotella sp.]
MIKDYNYKVIWIDDEWEELSEFKDECEELGIYLQPFTNQKDGMEELDKHPNLWDAIVLDGEIKDKSDNEEPSTKGLLTALMHLASLPINHQIPHFISTGKDKVKDNEMLKNEVIYEKGKDDEKLIDDLRNTIDNVERYSIKLQYKDIIDFLEEINKEVCDGFITILEKMHNPESNKNFDSKLYYNLIRQSLECLFIAANEKGVIPDECFIGVKPNIRANIDQCYRYLIGDPAFHAKVRYGLPGERIVPEYIENMMSLIKNTGNEFSHPNENNKTHYLLYSLAFHIYEIGIWLFHYFEENPNKEENLKKCVKIGNNVDGIIERDEKGYYHIGSEYSVLLKNIDLVGKKVRITNCKQNTSTTTKKYYPLFVREEDFQLVDE